MTHAHPNNVGNRTKGSDRPTSVLTSNDVEHMRELYGQEIEFELWRDVYYETAAHQVWTYKALAKFYGVSVACVANVVKRRTWKHVA